MKILIVGAGLYGTTLARLLADNDIHVTIIDKRNNVAGNAYTENINGIHVHKYGAHIFHTDNDDVWKFVNKFAKFNNFINSPIAKYKDELYSLPFNMNTFYQMWNVSNPNDAINIIKHQSEEIKNPSNLEEQAISLVGKDIYEKLVKEYTEKQWGRSCKELPKEIIKRLPVRFTFNNNYFNSKYQGIPERGYTQMVLNMLSHKNIELKLGVDYFENANQYNLEYDKIIYTGQIDKLFNYCYGKLEYRSLEFVHKELRISNFQGNAVVNYTSSEVPWTRIIEHKHFDKNCKTNRTIISYEYPTKWNEGCEPYYPINDEKNNKLYEKYRKIKTDIFIGGRLGYYKYYDMDKVIEKAMEDANVIKNNI